VKYIKTDKRITVDK